MLSVDARIVGNVSDVSLRHTRRILVIPGTASLLWIVVQ